MNTYTLKVEVQHLPLKSVFRIARGAKTQADVVVVTLTDGQYTGWAESVPYARYGESVDSVVEQIHQLNLQLSLQLSHQLSHQPLDKNSIDTLVANLPAGAARNALDCALWDLKAKQQHSTVARLLDLEPTKACITAQTLSIDTPAAMAKAVAELDNPPLVKVKLDNQHIIEKMTAIAKAAPNSQFIVDANEGWTLADLTACSDGLKQLNVVLIEQPLPAGADQALIDFNSVIALCADESCHTTEQLDYLKGRYQVVNIKLDKTGGLTEAVKLAQQARAQGFELMLGCMVGSSLAMAPASLLTAQAKFVDLDGPLLTASDREFGFEFCRGVMQPLDFRLWGGRCQRVRVL